MASSKRKFVALCLCVTVVTGCASVKVVRNPGEGDNGVRFYRPKPYLLVTPADPTGRLVNMKLEYLPDFNEEYSAHIQGKASVALKDGWNLVGVNTKEAPKDKEEPPAKIEDIKLPNAVVNASNVPIGYYESVYGFAGERKFLQGWRYIGMTVLGGNQPNICHVPGHTPTCPPNGGPAAGCISGPLYGLVFFNGAMTFRQLDEIANNQLCPQYVNPIPAEAPVTTPPRDSGMDRPKDNTGPSSSMERPTPPMPAPTTPSTSPAPPPGSASFSRPKVTPALVVAPSNPMLNTPSTGTKVTTVKPVPTQGVYVPLSKPMTTPPPLASASNSKVVPSSKVVTPTPAPKVTTLPALTTPSNSKPSSIPPLGMPSLDDDLFRTAVPPRP